MKSYKINRKNMRNPEKNKSILMIFYLKKRINLSRSFKIKKKIKINIFIYIKIKSYQNILSY